MEKSLPKKIFSAYIDELMTNARTGDSASACRLGDAYREGSGVEQSWEQAFRWYTLGARAGDAESQNNLGTLYLEGYYCQEDFKQAAYWYQKSADQGASVAQYNLAMRYIHGQGVPPDYIKAMQWLEKSADQGYNLAYYDLGIMHLHGEGCTPDRTKGLKLLMKGCIEGDVRAAPVLSDNSFDLDDMAINGNIDDWLILSDLYYEHLEVPESKCLGWFWLLWAKAHAPSDYGCLLIEIMTDRGMTFCTSAADKGIGQRHFNAVMQEVAPSQCMPNDQPPSKKEVTEASRPVDLPIQWQEACDPNSPIKAHNGNTPQGRDLLLSLGAEGGGIDLFGVRGNDGNWSFSCGLDDWTPELLDEPAIRRESESVGAWDAAIAILDKTCTHWMKLHPCYVHPEFRQPLLAVIERRLIVSRLVGKSKKGC
jgi:hypothetical protein